MCLNSYDVKAASGFFRHLEATRLTAPDRLQRLLVAVTLAYLWLLQIGFQVEQKGWWQQVDNRG